MMAVRARAKTVMAAVDRWISILDDFVGQSWNSWIDKANASSLEGLAEECNKNVKKRMETMTLRREDMSIYGYCPANDDFFLVVCSHCGQVVKPQAFEKHCERRHGNISKLHSPTSVSVPLQPPRPVQPASQRDVVREPQDSKNQGAGPLRASALTPSPLLKSAKTHKDGARVFQLDKLSQGSPSSPPRLSIPSPRDSSSQRGPTPPRVPSPKEKPLQKGLEEHCHLWGPRTYSRTYKKVPKKQCDFDKHCGVLDPERKKLCTRLLTCNLHSIHQRRQVVGRSKTFDQLVTELKVGSKAHSQTQLSRDGPESDSSCPEDSAHQTGSQHYRCQLISCATLRSRPALVCDIEEEEEEDESLEAPEVLSQLPHSPRGFSSEESEEEGQEELLDLPSSVWHPKPLGLCTFGSHALGCSVFTFDRKLHHLRFALSAMLKQHLSAHLWKKIPQVAEVRSHLIPASSLGSDSGSHDSARRAAPSSLKAGSTFLKSDPSPLPQRTSRENCSSGQSETRAVGSPTVSKTAPTLGPRRPHTPAGRPSKHPLQARLQQAEHSPTPSKRRCSPYEDEPSGLNRSQDSYERTRTVPTSHGPINGAHSPGKKPRPQAHNVETKLPSKGELKVMSSFYSSPESSSLSHSGDGASGIHRRTLSYEHTGAGKKRKTSGASSQIPKPSSQSESALYSWNKSTRGEGVSISLNKKRDTQKPKLHH
ncbi:ataxin-7-like protein 2b [Chanos chanos]|uniref:Ataxin-7-like protein 2b n=1 Tax=Chanos chanos TaxID=29144 RepID=A0A6J2W6M1_CHACN|nr:ataxin-7-like protein 2 [Chanos chanos]